MYLAQKLRDWIPMPVLAATSLWVAGLTGVAVAAPPPPLRAMTLDADGTVHAEGVTIEVSSLLSPSAKAAVNAKLHSPPPKFDNTSVAELRATADRVETELLGRWRKIYGLTITPAIIDGVQTDIVTPAAGVAPENRKRVLINLHGGGYITGGRFGGQAESAPLAGRGRIKVVAVDYRMAPEHTFPAASEDVEKVYVALLKTYAPANIGIYGCSAGGALTGQAVAWLQSRHLPRPGAVGMFCAGAMPGFWRGGDSESVNAALNAVPGGPGGAASGLAAFRSYWDGVDQTNPLVTPGLYPEVLAKFPPTLLVVSTRDVALSNVIVTNTKLLEAGATTQLLVLEGIGHGQFTDFAGTPEATSAYGLIWRFFDAHLGQ